MKFRVLAIAAVVASSSALASDDLDFADQAYRLWLECTRSKAVTWQESNADPATIVDAAMATCSSDESSLKSALGRAIEHMGIRGFGAQQRVQQMLDDSRRDLRGAVIGVLLNRRTQLPK